MKLKYFAGWFLLLVTAFINGTLRQVVFQKPLGDLHAHQLSTLIGILLFAFVINRLIKRWKPESLNETIKIGLLWLALTFLFETGMAKFLQKRDWVSVFNDYNILEGRVWILILIWVAAAPSFFYKLHQKNNSGN